MIHELAKTAGAAMPLTSLVTELHRKLVGDGLGQRDTSEIIRLYRTGPW
jgi:3-hydroxyisobutyrate dehydrogenase-like beta-hydroxyacid dehydrogenase